MPPAKRTPKSGLRRTPGQITGKVAHKAAARAGDKMTGKTPPKTIPLRKSPDLRRASPAAIDLGVLNQHLGYFVRRLQVSIFQDFIRRLSSIDISPAQFSVLVVIGANEGLSQAQLAATLCIERARMVRMLHLLEKRELTQRLPSSADGRRHALRLTRAGQTILRRAQALAALHEDGLKKKLGPGRHQMLLDAVREF
jgi:DNA-binding MarR family transcriptional regulator